MKKIIFTLLTIITISSAYAALPPWHRKTKDLDVMVDFIKQHQNVAMGLQFIDLRDFSIYFGDDCSATFERKKTNNNEQFIGWAGPAQDLEFKESNCEI